jgi:hypothetical protein
MGNGQIEEMVSNGRRMRKGINGRAQMDRNMHYTAAAAAAAGAAAVAAAAAAVDEATEAAVEADDSCGGEPLFLVAAAARNSARLAAKNFSSSVDPSSATGFIVGEDWRFRLFTAADAAAEFDADAY